MSQVSPIIEILPEDLPPPTVVDSESDEDADIGPVLPNQDSSSTSSSSQLTSSTESEEELEQEVADSDEDSSGSPILRTRRVAHILQEQDSTRQRQETAEMALRAEIDPKQFRCAVKEEHWRKVMREEFLAIQRNQTWEMVQRPADETKIIGLKWIYRSKHNSDGSLNKHKARLVVKGYFQEYGIDYSETFAPVAKLETVRMLIVMAAQNQ